MKNLRYKKYYISLLLIIGLTSCEKNFLDLNPHDSLSTGTFWKTANDATMALTGVYNSFYQSYFMMDLYPVWDAYSDNAWDFNDAVGARDNMTGPISSSSGGLVTDYYNNAYRQIAICNSFLDNVGNVSATPDQINEWKAEVLFVRAFYYFYLYQFYGGVPLILHTYSVTDPILAKSTRAQVEAQVLADLNTAIQYLPNVAYTDGHAVQGAALLLKARVYLYDSQWQDAANTAKQIMQSGTFHLYSNYENIFLDAGQGSDNTEIMFSVKYLSPNFENNSRQRFGYWMNVVPLQNLVDDYEGTDGLPINQSKVYDPANPYNNRDPRLNESIFVPGSILGLSGDNAEYWSDRIQYLTMPLKYDMKKYNEMSITSQDAGTHCENDLVLMRYAEVLLIYAEAQNELAGPTGDVYAAIDQVRARSGMPSAESDPSALTQDGLRQKIRHERRVELAFEGQRWLDLKRWQLADQKINAVGLDQVPVKYVFSSNNYLWPFPQAEIDYYKAHGLTFGQNPGY